MQTEGHGATVILHGETFDAAYAHARVLEAERGYTFVHPFDDPRIIAGQGTVAIEMLEDVPDHRHAGHADRRRRADLRHGDGRARRRPRRSR